MTSEEAERAHLPIADAHNDLLLACMHRKERGVADPFGDDWLPGLRVGGVVFQVLPIFTEEQFVGEAALRRTLEIIALAHEIADLHRADVAIVEHGSDIDPVIDSGRIALLLALEGAEPIGSSLAMFETMSRLGVRLASLTWNRRTMLADGTAEAGTGSRLSSLGIEAVAEMERLQMVLDVSHLSDAGVQHIAEVAVAPFVATHSSCRALCRHARNLTDVQIRTVAGSGGFVGINAFGPFVSETAPTLDDFIDHIAHAARVAGDDHVGIGADFIDDLVRTVNPILGRQLLIDPDEISFIDVLKAPADFAGLSSRLVERFGVHRALRFASANMVDFFRAAVI
ncbi:dipeptidase [Candidatus Poriferisodalis sp.]|uniref:dipeptidase n=1 Tax=Candidatus Poriferisodalis sp. TaxID=3101277 RepID=UPI003D0EC5E7